MKEFSCGDVVPGCTAKFRAATTEEIMASVAQHAREAHGMTTIPPEVAARVQSLVRESA